MNVQCSTPSPLPMYGSPTTAGRPAASLEKLAELIQRLWLFPGDMASNHKSYRALMDWMIAGAPSAATKAALLSVVGHVNRRDYLQALATLRAIAI